MASSIFRIVSRGRYWPKNQIFTNQLASFRSTAARHGYEGDGKTTITAIDSEVGQHLLVTGYNENGFRLSNGSMALGSCILFPNLIFQWNIKSIEEINEESLSLFKLLEPKLDVLILGIGNLADCSHENVTALRQIVNRLGLTVEIMPTRTAVSTYNYTLADFRVVAGAFLPPKMSDSKEQYKLDEVRTTRNAFLDFQA